MAITIALLMTTFAGISGLSIDIADWYSTKRAMQSAVDAAALGGALRMLNGDTSAEITSAATTDGTLNSVGMASGGTLSISVDMTGETVTAAMSKTADMLLSGVVLGSAPTISVVAKAGVNSGPSTAYPCLLITSPKATKAIDLEGSSSIQASGCPIHVNSTDASSIYLTGNTKINASSICSAGGTNIQGSSSISPAKTTCAAFTDTAANLTPPSNVNNACDYTNYTINNNNEAKWTDSSGTAHDVIYGSSTDTMSPGVYCGGINLASSSGDAIVSFQSGIYVVRNGGLVTGNNSTLSGTGVGFWLTGTNNVATISGNNGSTNLTISAPTSGTMAGISIYQDGSAANGTETNTLAGNSTITFTGMLYFGHQNVTVAGSSEDQGAPFTSMVAYTLYYNGYSTLYLNSNYSGTSVPQVYSGGASTVALLE
jgi:hypothetical protein